MPTLKNETLTMCIKNSLIKFCNNSERLCMGYFSYTPPLGTIKITPHHQSNLTHFEQRL